MIGQNDYGTSKDANAEEESAPWILIIVAVSIGGVITSICVGVLVFIAIKTIRHRGLKGLQRPPSSDTEEEDR